MQIRASFVADAQPLELMQPGGGALDDPAHRMIGQLYHCLQKRVLFDEQSAFPTPSLTEAAAA
ncbi:hypothetical protein GCM10010271_73900 [Streptomyces kurssanovii]|nr:hypothetical protein GCM10010271_73900 [Streptomyces kurssanovii]